MFLMNVNVPRFPSLLLRRAFWNAAGATHPVAHAKAMKQMERLSKSAHDHMKQIPATVWTKAFFGTHCQADSLDNNMSESFNAWIINERFVIIPIFCYNLVAFLL